MIELNINRESFFIVLEEYTSFRILTIPENNQLKKQHSIKAENTELKKKRNFG